MNFLIYGIQDNALNLALSEQCIQTSKHHDPMLNLPYPSVSTTAMKAVIGQERREEGGPPPETCFGLAGCSPKPSTIWCTIPSLCEQWSTADRNRHAHDKILVSITMQSYARDQTKWPALYTYICEHSFTIVFFSATLF